MMHGLLLVVVLEGVGYFLPLAPPIDVEKLDIYRCVLIILGSKVVFFSAAAVTYFGRRALRLLCAVCGKRSAARPYADWPADWRLALRRPAYPGICVVGEFWSWHCRPWPRAAICCFETSGINAYRSEMICWVRV